MSTLAHLSPHFSHCVSVKYSQFLQCLNQSISHLAPGQVLVGGFDNDILSSVELFPRPSPDACSIPDLPQARYGHSLSLLSGGRIVVCGGSFDGDSLSSVELFPRSSSDACSIPDLPQARDSHSLSLLSGGKIVVCGGSPSSTVGDSCLSWVAGTNSWTDTLNFNMR